jgi:hypothetical protein
MASDDRTRGVPRQGDLPVTEADPAATAYVPAALFPEAEICTYEVVGDSMTGDGINPGDLVVVDQTQVPRDGEIAVVHITNWRNPGTGQLVSGWVVKRLRGGGSVLESSNPAYPPMVLGAGHSPIIQGVVIGVVTLGSDGRPHGRRIREPRVSESSVPIIVVSGELADQLKAMARRPGDDGAAPPEDAD